MYLLGIQENKPYDILYFPNRFHCFDQAWSIVEAGTLMGCASWCMDRFQRNSGCRPGLFVVMCILFGSCLPSIGTLWGKPKIFKKKW